MPTLRFQSTGSLARRGSVTWERAKHPCLRLHKEPVFCNYEIWLGFFFFFSQNMNSEIVRAASTTGKARQRPPEQSERVFARLE